MKIYTKTGDGGETGLFGGPRVPKDHPRIAAYGEVDELNTVLGLVRAEQPPAEIDALLAKIQHELFSVGAELATPNPAAHGTRLIGEAQIAALEQAIDLFEERLTPPRQFILPGGTKVAAGLHLSRAVCSRAERLAVTLARDAESRIAPDIVRYLNRLSDLLFVLARAANQAAGVADVSWQSPRKEP